MSKFDALLKSIGHIATEEDLRDPEGTRRISYPEFVRIMIAKMKAIKPEIVKAFEVFDVDHNGFVSPQELHDVLADITGMDIQSEDIKSMIEVADRDGDGQINIGIK